MRKVFIMQSSYGRFDAIEALHQLKAKALTQVGSNDIDELIVDTLGTNCFIEISDFEERYVIA